VQQLTVQSLLYRLRVTMDSYCHANQYSNQTQLSKLSFSNAQLIYIATKDGDKIPFFRMPRHI
jgi:hypothetical protein